MWIRTATFILLALWAGLASAQNPDSTGSSKSEQGQVQFSATDSLVFELRGGRKATLFGSAKIVHSSGELKAGTVMLDLDQSEMTAESAVTSDTLALPVLSRDGEELRSRRIRFNYKTEKGKFEHARVQVSEGSLIGEQVKRAEPHVVYVKEGMYSTCTLDHPHFYIKAIKMKVKDEEEIFFTRAKLYLLDIPYPLLLPFGYVPADIKKRKSGPLAPQFMNVGIQTRGYGLNNLGWFQYFNDYLTGSISAGVYTSGTYNGDLKLQYRKTGKLNGNISFGFSREQGLEPTDPTFSRRRNRNLNINHSQTISPYSSFSANIIVRTSDYYQRNSTSINERAEQTTNSKASYTYAHPEGVFTFNANAQQTQNFANNEVFLSGPSTSFSLRSLTPFQKENAGSQRKWYESFSVRYSNSFNSNFRFRPTAADSSDVLWYDALFNPDVHREATGSLRHINYGLSHTASASSQLLPSNYLQLTGNFSVREYWYPNTVEKTWDPDSAAVITTLREGFFAARDFSAGINFTTTVFGIWNKRIGNLTGFRHTFRPTISYNFRPDFSSERYGYYRSVQRDTLGNTQQYPVFEGSIIGGPAGGRSQSMSISISNILETKRVKRDSTGQKQEKIIRIIDNLSLNTSYNFAAEQFKLSDLRMNATSNIGSKLRLNANASFTFYGTDTLGNRIDQYLWDISGKPVRLTNFSINASTSFREGQMRADDSFVYFPANYDPLNQTYFSPVDPGFFSQPVVWYDVPWSVSLNFTYNWTRTNPDNLTRRAILNASNISLRLTPKWQVGTSLGYDFIAQELTPSRFRFNRTLHCWNLSMEWNPFGDFKFFMFSLNVNSNQFNNIFQKLPGLNNLRRSSANNSRI